MGSVGGCLWMGVVDLVCALVHGDELERSERGNADAGKFVHGLPVESCFDGKELRLCDAVEPGMLGSISRPP